ncbi:carbohydrate ABC transporter permease [Haploplasma modicum]|uniref:carbohydrate ABC transporter permease n=1 Tax=Haploplasma modicum TaxID=2150 RepID=UPI00138AD702|nr:sugar ABC transporter permease [Haploplasma modicum]
MKKKSYLKGTASAIIPGLGQLLNKQVLKAIFFFLIFALFISLELQTGNYFVKEEYENQVAYNKIPGKDFGDSWYNSMLENYYGVKINSSVSSSDKARYLDLEFEEYLDEIGVDVVFNESKGKYDIKGMENLTEDKALKYFAMQLSKSSPRTYTNLKNGDVISYEDFDSTNYKNIKTKEVLFYNEESEIFFYELRTELPDKSVKKEYVQTNLFTNNMIENPIVLDKNDGLIEVNKLNSFFTDENNNIYLSVEIKEGETKEVKFIKINFDNKLEYSLENITLTKKVIQGPIYISETDFFEYYEPSLLHNGVRLQYKEPKIMNIFRFTMGQTFRTPGNNYNATDFEKLMLKVYFEINPDIRDNFVLQYDNFFHDKAGMFIKGYWSVVTLGNAKKQNFTSYNALREAMIGKATSKDNISQYISLVESVPIQGHISTMMLIEGLIAVILSLFFFIFNVWSAMDAYKVQEQRRKEEKVFKTKEYFKSVWDNGFEYIVLSPALFVLAFISIMPILFGFIIAFTSISGNQSMVENFNYVGLKNFIALFDFNSSLGSSFGKAFWGVLGWTIIWAVLSTVTVFFGGFIQALILNSDKVVLRKLWRTILILPWAIPALLSQMVFSVMFKEVGFINQILRDIGVYNILQNIGILGKPFSEMTGFLKYFWLGNENIQWFTNAFNTNFVKTTLVVVNIWLGFPYFMALMTGIMTAIDKTLYEASDIDGATGFQKITKITIPLVLYSTAPILIMTFSGNFNNFGVIYFITGGGPNTGLASRGYAGSTDILISWMYSLTVDYSIYNMASAFSVLVFLFVGSITAWNLSKTRAFQGD